MKCNVCGSLRLEALFDSGAGALTTLCERRGDRAVVLGCQDCGHLVSPAMEGSAGYYANHYRILLDSADQDQIHEIRDGRIIYRSEHQLATLTRLVDLPAGARVLDFGCAKAATPRRWQRERPDLALHVFDVSEMYRHFWAEFLPADRCAVHAPPPHWLGSFDAVTSFFAFEHIDRPAPSMRLVADLLVDGGLAYIVVPDAFGNLSDWLVVDHVSHFTAASLQSLLADAGLQLERIDDQVHRGALVALARKSATATRPEAAAIATALDRARQAGALLERMDQRIALAEAEAGDEPAAIYGAGVYGAWIYNRLRNPERVRCFLDRSPYQQGKSLFDRPVLAPEALPADIATLYVGLNPVIARTSLQGLDLKAARPAFLD